MIRVAIADDHQLVREGLRRIVEGAPGLSVVTEIADGDGVLPALGSVEVDVLLMDISMPGLGFLRVMDELRTRYPDLPVLVVSMHPEKGWAVQALKAGAAGYLTKTCSAEELIVAIRDVHAGGRHLTPAVAQALAGAVIAPRGGGGTTEALSRREFEVLQKLGQGKMAKTVAWEMGISPKTVSVYRARVLKKLGLKSNADLVRYSSEHGLLE